MPSSENSIRGKVVTTTTKTTVRTETKKTVEVRETSDSDGIQMVISGPMPIKVIVKNLSYKASQMDKIVNELWVPIRKLYRLVNNVDVVMCPVDCFVPELDDSGEPLKGTDGKEVQCPAVMFQFLWSKTYNDYGLSTDEKYVYQRLVRREKVKGDIRGFQDDPTKVRMTYVARNIYEEFQSNQKKLEERHRSKTVIVRKMRIPSDKTIAELMEAEVNEFVFALQEYAKSHDFEKKPEVTSFKYGL